MNLSYKISDNDNFVNVLQVLKEHFLLSDRLITKLKKNKKIYLNSKETYTKQKVISGDIVSFILDFDEDNSNIVPSNIPLDIIYEDEYLLILNKPAGIAIHPSILHYDNSLSNGVKFYFDKIKLNKKIAMRRVQMRNELAKKRRGIIPYLPEEWISKDVTGDLYGTISPDIKLGKQFKRQDEFYQKYKRIRDPLVISNNGFLLSGYNSVSISKKHEIPWQLQKIVLENVFVYLRRGTPY